MECLKYLNSYEEVESIVQLERSRRIFNQGFLEHYRGQDRPEYLLLPSIARTPKTPNEIKNDEKEFTKNLLKQFRKEGLFNILRIDRALNDEQNLWNIQFQAQHLGVKTRFLDWSLSWEIALWFAVENKSNDNVNGQFWVFTVPNTIHSTDTVNCYYDKDLKNLDRTYFINAPIYWSDELPQQTAEIKRSRQHGKFTVSPFEKSIIPLEEHVELKGLLEKYCISAASKGQIRHVLSTKGYNDEWVNYRENYNELLYNMAHK